MFPVKHSRLPVPQNGEEVFIKRPAAPHAMDGRIRDGASGTARLRRKEARYDVELHFGHFRHELHERPLGWTGYGMKCGREHENPPLEFRAPRIVPEEFEDIIFQVVA